MWEQSEKQNSFIAEKCPTIEEIERVRKLMGSFILALRKLSIYPEDNNICKESLSLVKNHIHGFLSDHEYLRIFVEKDQFLFQGKNVYQDQLKEQSLAFQLYREGLRWFEFQKGFTIEELNIFLKLLNRYRKVKEESEDDLVTALWESGFLHMQYKVDNVIWADEPLIDFSSLKAKPDHVEWVEETEKEKAAPTAKNAMLAPAPAFGGLTSAEKRQIQDMIIEDEARNSVKDVLDMMIIILKERRDPRDFAATLNFLVEEFRYDFSECEFYFIWQFLENLKTLQKNFATDKPWMPPLLNDFRQKISRPEVLGILQEVRPQINIMDADHWEAFRQTLLLLPSEVMLTLGPIIPNADYPRLEQMLMEIMSIHANRSLEAVKQLIDKAELPLIRRIIHILRSVREQDPTELLLKLTRHPSDAVRKDAISAMVGRDPQNLRKLFPLIEDPRLSIRNHLCEQMGKLRGSLAEELLLDYLENRRFKLKDQKHILACYRALGRCASTHSLPFLQKSLLRKNWYTFLGFGASLQRQGAALALLMMNKEAARTTLKIASRSLFRGIRLAYRQAVDESARMKMRG